MTLTEKKREEILKELEKLTEEKLDTLIGFLRAVNETPEQKKASKEKAAAEQEARKQKHAQEKEAQEAALKNWIADTMQGYEVPEAQDYTIREIEPVLNYMAYNAIDKNSVFYSAAAMFDYGFKKGAEYAQSNAV